MTNSTPDILVIGLGAMGSATAHHLAQRGAKVIGIDQFAPPHHHGSTHGESRITREAVGEGASFVPLVMRSHMLWRELEAATGETLFTQCGGLILGHEGRANLLHEQADFLGSTRRVAEQFGIAHSMLNHNEIAARFPQFALAGDEIGYYEPGAGYLHPEACVRAHLSQATKHGAALHTGETVQVIRRDGAQTIVETDRARYTPGTTIVTAGPWLPALVPALASNLVIRRQVLFWFALNSTQNYSRDAFPIFIWPWGGEDGEAFYGFPQSADGTIKLASEQRGTTTTPSSVNREVTEAEIDAMFRTHVQPHLRGVSATCVKATTCLYTNAPRAQFLIDRLPDAPDVIVVSACSGHGFKHSPAIGEALAEMSMSGATPDALAPFNWQNFQA